MTASMTSSPVPLELLPSKATYGAAEPVVVEIRGLTGPGQLSVWRLGDQVLKMPVAGDGFASLGQLSPGGYGVELTATPGYARTAVEVHGSDRRTMRYGFVADYSPQRDVEAVTENVRRLHLTDVQFYDWAYRHADLLGGGDRYEDALGQPVALATVRRLVEELHGAGTTALGYAAVYAVGRQEWEKWQHVALRTPSGGTYGLGDFLSLVDPAAPEWLDHLSDQLDRAAREVGFDGFHLDQYGYPKRAARDDSSIVDLAESFLRVITRMRETLPDARLVFNNVNNFPTWHTARAPQNAVYVEVWAPHDTLGDLAALAMSSRRWAGERPVVLAAYQHVYDLADARSADLAASLTMATLFSHGATQLLAGEADRILVDPYYVRNHRVTQETSELLRRWYDFLVEHGDLLMDPRAIEVTGSYADSYNDDCDVSFDQTRVSGVAIAGTVWRRVVAVSDTLVVHLVNLTGQDDTLWDAPRKQPGSPGRGLLRVRRTSAGVPRVRVSDPDGIPRLVDLPVVVDGDHIHVELPELCLWQLIVVTDDAGV